MSTKISKIVVKLTRLYGLMMMTWSNLFFERSVSDFLRHKRFQLGKICKVD